MTQISLLGLSIIEEARNNADQLKQLSELDEMVEVLNQVRRIYHEASPFREHPIDYVEWAPSDLVEGNTYNPNKVAPPEMKLLEKSILHNGYAMPIVVVNEKDTQDEDGKGDLNIKRIIDGFHKGEIGKTRRAVRKKTFGYLPISYINPGRWALTDRMAATIQFNVHGEATVEGLSELVLKFARKGWSQERIAKELGWELDKVKRLWWQIGLPEVFQDHDFQEAWEIVEAHSLAEVLTSTSMSACGEWEGKSFMAEKGGVDFYHLFIDDTQVRVEEVDLFVLIVKIEEEIQQRIPSYTVGEEVWFNPLNDFIDR